MVKVVHTPAVAYTLFTSDALSGWPSCGIRYSPTTNRRKKPKRKPDHMIAPPVTKLEIGELVSH